ncbi:hypothetical protein K438DRAFT_1761665 [Mycena galopus ATCC 62051]|nr:hypothetical protein K438DRAFT_1761665 [Mycena galopus ATCC 62051]
MSISSFQPTHIIPSVCGDLDPSLPCGCIENYERAASTSVAVRERSKNIVGERNRVVPGLGSGTVAKQETILEAGARQRRTIRARSVHMLGKAGAAPAPSLRMLMPHRPGTESRMYGEARGPRVEGQGRGRDGEDGLTAVGGHHGEESAAAAASQALHELGTNEQGGADTCADARTGIAASYDRAWIIGVPPARQMSASALHCWRRAKAKDLKKSPGKTKSKTDSEELYGKNNAHLGTTTFSTTCCSSSSSRAFFLYNSSESLFVTIRGLFGFGTHSTSKRTQGAEVEVDVALVDLDVGIKGQAMEEDVDSEGAKDGERVIKPEAGCVVDILPSFTTRPNPGEGETEKTGGTRMARFT